MSDIDKLLDACDNMKGRTICVLADACAMPVESMLKKFRGEFEAIAKSDDEVEAIVPKVSGQMAALMETVRARQMSK